MNKLRSRVAELVLSVAAVSAVLLPVGIADASPKPAASPATRIALSQLGTDFRVTLTAIQGPS